MAKQSICILDDQIPVSKFTDIVADDTSLIDKNLFNHYLKSEEKWDDVDLMKFSKAVSEKDQKYLISGFRSHDFFFNYLEENIFSPDIVIFDWDLDDSGKDSEKNLLFLLQNTFALVGIFTSADKNDEITNVLQKGEFKEYEHNLFLIRKDENNAFQTLVDKIEEKIKHFSFQKGKDIKQKTLNAVDSVLGKISTLSYEQFVSLFGKKILVNGTEKAVISFLEYIEIISEKATSQLIGSGLFSGDIEVNYAKTINKNLIRKAWRLRLFQEPKDNIVRKGDIIRLKHDEESKYLVISSDCHLSEFWKKNHGYLSLIPILKISSTKFEEKLKSFDSENTKKFRITSVTNVQFLSNITVIPGVFSERDQDGIEIFEDGILYPKNVVNKEIGLEEGKNPKEPLIYDNINIIGNDRIRIVEPFLNPIIQFSLKNITDIGVPDFPVELNDIIKEEIRNIVK
jgi:hypothetical protein